MNSIRDRMSAALEGLEARWRAVDAPVLAHLREGLSDEAMDEIAAEYGYELGPQQRAWFAWHDGVDGGVSTRPETQVKPHATLFSLREALDLSAQLSPPPDLVIDPVEMPWDPRWLPFLWDADSWVSFTPHPDGPSLVTGSGSFPINAYIATTSMEHFVDIWCWGLDHGVICLENGIWTSHDGNIPDVFAVMSLF